MVILTSMKFKMSNNPQGARLMLQIGLAAVFLYAAVSSLQKPDEWTAYLPNFLTNSISPVTLVKGLAVYELVLAAWLLSGKYLKLAGLFCAMTLGGILVVNPHQLLVTFRDIGLLFMSLALVLLAD
jgi:hypothetical protein